MATNLSDLRLTPSVLGELRQRGYETAEDMAHLTIAESLRIPGLGGRDWRKIAAAQGREPHTATSRRP
ncbi:MULTISPECIES: hypothetical protein [Agrobacterium]|uniref:Helix-hairpin-helix domain-containing protein n=1 Tax=Agrobacterium larrymoorei TaxID=160699 RepID=A0ABX8TC50_9HYPH|nr:hypothetical protein [Agrobacterium larrymoorei]NSZ10119.1 hypothetical protein [Agrobacterium tumefaciens]QYA10837.1 hypothetical protein J5285_25765 [Agrobacterium larrymoorei]